MTDKTEATHICADCGALWRSNPDEGDGGSWSLKSPKCGACCDNAEMGIQIVSLADADGLAAELEITREEAAALMYVELQAEKDADERGRCCNCRHYKPDPEAGRIYFGVPNADSGWYLNPEVKSGRKDFPHADMLSGDGCSKFEAII